VSLLVDAGSITFLVDCGGLSWPYLGERLMLSHATVCDTPDVTWSIVGAHGAAQSEKGCLSIEEALAQCASFGYPAKAGRLWSHPSAQAHLETHRDTLGSCAIEWRTDAITVFDFAKRQLLSILSHEASDDLANRRVDPSLWAPFFCLYSAILLHSSAVVRNGGAVVFLAPDEGGKTTAARTAPADTVLSDDQNVVRRGTSGFRVHSTHWSLFLGPPRSAPLRAFFRLEKAKRFEIVRLMPKDLVESVWQEQRVPLQPLPKPLRELAVALVCEASRAAPAFTMRLPEGYVDWDAVDRAIASS
jgi:hypothetical protein